MLAPSNYKDLSDEELLKQLTKAYDDAKTAAYVLEILRGRIKPSHPLD